MPFKTKSTPKQLIGRLNARMQSASGPPAMDYVTICVRRMTPGSGFDETRGVGERSWRGAPMVFRVVPYEEWRKHYAKDKEGRYRGTHEPAPDCLLLPADVVKWRGNNEVLPAYEGVGDLPPYDDAPPYEA
jgi:hypothetical protein